MHKASTDEEDKDMPETNKQEAEVTNITAAPSTKRSTRIDEIREGATVKSGKKVRTVFSRNVDYVIYSLEGSDSIQYRWKIDDPEVNSNIRKFETLCAKAREKLKGAQLHKENPYRLAILRAIFKERSSDAFASAFQEFDAYIKSAREIKSVVSRAENFVVWINDEGRVGYSFGRDLPDVENVLSEFSRILTMADDLLPAVYQKKIQRRLGVALAAGFRGDFEPFKRLESDIQTIAENNLRRDYLVVTSAGGIIMIALSYLAYRLLILPEFLHVALIVVAGGFLGTFISVLERSKTLRVGNDESARLIILQGMIRVFLGGAFGLIAYAAAVSGLAFSILKGANAALLLLGVVAGFSERRIPDLIDGISPG
jgi:hypothetical protein